LPLPACSVAYALYCVSSSKPAATPLLWQLTSLLLLLLLLLLLPLLLLAGAVR
jgi:hypothetical protein